MIDASEIGRKLQKQFWLANASESRKQLLRWETKLSISRLVSIYACVGPQPYRAWPRVSGWLHSTPLVSFGPSQRKDPFLLMNITSVSDTLMMRHLYVYLSLSMATFPRLLLRSGSTMFYSFPSSSSSLSGAAEPSGSS